MINRSLFFDSKDIFSNTIAVSTLYPPSKGSTIQTFFVQRQSEKQSDSDD